MTPKEICDVLVKVEILVKHSALGYRLRPYQNWIRTPEEVIADWRVVEACLERMSREQILAIPLLDTLNPSAICQAFAEAYDE